MLFVKRLVKYDVLQVSIQGTRSAGFPSFCCHTIPVRTLSDVRILSGVRTLTGGRTLLGVRTYPMGLTLGIRWLSGGADGDAGAGWYGRLSDAAPVHLCEEFLVNLQQVSGLPWWLSIVVSTMTVRTLITLPLAAYQMVIIAKVSDGGHEDESALNYSKLLID